VTLIVSNCPKLTDAAFEYLGREVKVLDLTDCELITDKTLFFIASRCPKLKSIKLSGKNIRYYEQSAREREREKELRVTEFFLFTVWFD
jgi:hypothetical protein